MIKFEIDYNFSMMKYLRVYKGMVFDMIYDIDIEQPLPEIKKAIAKGFEELPVKIHPQNWITPKIVEWINANN